MTMTRRTRRGVRDVTRPVSVPFPLPIVAAPMRSGAPRKRGDNLCNFCEKCDKLGHSHIAPHTPQLIA